MAKRTGPGYPPSDDSEAKKENTKPERTQEEIDAEKAELLNELKQSREAVEALLAKKNQSTAKPSPEITEPADGIIDHINTEPGKVSVKQEQTQANIEDNDENKEINIDLDEKKAEIEKILGKTPDKIDKEFEKIQKKKNIKNKIEPESEIEKKKIEIKKIFEQKETFEITEEFLLGRLGDIERQAEQKLENSKFKGSIIKGLEKWENFGQGEPGEKGFAKRMTKNAINLALIGLVSSFAVDKLAEAGVGTATALGGGVFSYTGRKMAIGLGFAAAFDKMGGKVVMGEKMKKAMPWIVGVGSVAAGTLLSGGMVGVASGLGMIASRLLKKQFTNEKIEKRTQVSKEKLLAKIKMEGDTIETKKLSDYEKEYAKILKKYENQKIWGKVVDGASRLTLASTISALTLEASGFAKDNLHHDKTESLKQKETEPILKEKDIAKSDSILSGNTKLVQEQVVNTNEYPGGPIKFNPEQDPFDYTKSYIFTDETTATSELPGPIGNPLQTEVKLSINPDAIIHKGQGIEHALIRQIEHNPTIAKELGFKGDITDAKALHQFAGHQAHVIAIKEGYVGADGSEVRIGEADKVGYELRIENGHTIVDEKTIDGKIIETHSEGDAFEKTTEKYEYTSSQKVSHLEQADSSATDNTTTTKSQFEIDHPQTTPNIDEQLVGSTETKEELVNNAKKIEIENKTPEKLSEFEKAHPQTTPNESVKENLTAKEIVLSDELLSRVKDTYNYNISKMFPESIKPWEEIKNSQHLTADKVMSLNENDVNETYKPLVFYIHKLKEVTDLNPVGKTLLTKPETILEYVDRALKKSAEIWKLDKLKL